MSLYGALVTRARAVSGVTDLIGTGSNARLYARIMPQAVTLPAATLTEISAVRVHAMGADPGLVAARMQLSCFDTTADDAKALANAFRAAWSRWSGTADTTTVDDIFLENERDLYEDVTTNHRTDLDFIVWYQE